MSITSRLRSAWTGFWNNSLYTTDDPDGFIPITPDQAFDVSAMSEEKFLALSAYFACIRNISEDIGKLPLIIYRRTADGKGKERATDHEYYKMLRYRPASFISSQALRETLVRFAAGWGRAYGRIYRSRSGAAHTIIPLHPMNVTPVIVSGGNIEYEIKRPGSKESVRVKSEDMIHIHGVSSNGIDGMSVAAYGRESMITAHAVRSFGKNLYTTNGRPGGYLKTAAKLSPEARDANVEAWKKAHSGQNMGGTAMLDNGLDYAQVTVNPTDAQFLETCQYTIEDVARWFRMPLHKIQYLVRAQGWSTLDAQNTDYLTDTLLPWLMRIEEEFSYKLLGSEDGYFCEHLVDSILRSDVKTRTESYVKMFSIGAYSINEIRAKENLNPIPGKAGDRHFVPLNMTPAEFADSIGGRQSDSTQSDFVSFDIKE